MEGVQIGRYSSDRPVMSRLPKEIAYSGTTSFDPVWQLEIWPMPGLETLVVTYVSLRRVPAISTAAYGDLHQLPPRILPPRI